MTSRSDRAELTNSWTLPDSAFAGRVPIGVLPSNTGRSLAYARDMLDELRIGVVSPEAAVGGVLLADGPMIAEFDPAPYSAVVRLWDFQVGRDGSGSDASAISGVSWVLGLPSRPPLALPAGLPERSCGLMGVYVALALLV